MNWISEKIKVIRDVLYVQDKLTISAVAPSLDEEFYNSSIAIIVGILSKLCPKWKNIRVRAESIYKLFLSFLQRM